MAATEPTQHSFDDLAVWRTSLPGVQHAVLPPSSDRPNPRLSDGMLFVSVFAPECVYALAAASGEICWRREGEAGAVQAEAGEEPVGIDDVESWGLGAGGWGLGTVEHIGFETRDAVETPGGVCEFLDELGLGGSGGFVFVQELAAMALEGGWVFRGQDGGAGG
jgi:hypothetical protein